MKSSVELPELEYEELLVRYTEQEALLDLPRLFNLIELKKIKVSSKTKRPSAATSQLLAENLIDGDYYPIEVKVSKWDQIIGPMKAFSWPMLLQASKLVQINGAALGLRYCNFRYGLLY